MVTGETLTATTAIESPPTITSAFRDVAQVYTGRQAVNGDLTFPFIYEGFETLLLHCFGSIDAQAGGSVKTQTFNLSPTGRFRNSNSPSLSLHVSRGVVGSSGQTDPVVFTYNGCVVDAFSFSVGSPSGPLEFTVTLFGKTDAVATSSPA